MKPRGVESPHVRCHALPPCWNVDPVVNKNRTTCQSRFVVLSLRNAQNPVLCQPYRGSALSSSSRKSSEQGHPACSSYLCPLQWGGQWPCTLGLPSQNVKQISFSRHHSSDLYERLVTSQTGNGESHRPSRITEFRRAILRSRQDRLRSDFAALHGPIRYW